MSRMYFTRLFFSISCFTSDCTRVILSMISRPEIVQAHGAVIASCLQALSFESPVRNVVFSAVVGCAGRDQEDELHKKHARYRFCHETSMKTRGGPPPSDRSGVLTRTVAFVIKLHKLSFTYINGVTCRLLVAEKKTDASDVP